MTWFSSAAVCSLVYYVRRHICNFISTVPYKPLVEMSPNLQLTCTWHKDELITFRRQQIKGYTGHAGISLPIFRMHACTSRKRITITHFPVHMTCYTCIRHAFNDHGRRTPRAAAYQSAVSHWTVSLSTWQSNS